MREDWDQDYGGVPRRKITPEDGAEVTRRTRSTYDLENQLESIEDQYELTLNGEQSPQSSILARPPPAGTPNDRPSISTKKQASPTSALPTNSPASLPWRAIRSSVCWDRNEK